MQKRRKYKPRPPKSERQINGDLEEEKRRARPVRPADAEKARARTLQRAVKLLAAKPRSVAELRERLLEKEWASAEAVDAALARLKEYGYLDDERFAHGFASYRVKQKPVGRGRLARDLQMKQVPRETADAALDLVYGETPEEELIARAIEKRVRLRGLPSTRQETKSLYEHLLRLGFPYDLIIRKVREASAAVGVDEDDAAETGDASE
jgi:regulatory protein